MTKHQILEVDRIQRLRDKNKVQMVLIPVQEPENPQPWQEHYLEVDPADEKPTGTRFHLTSTYELEEVAE